MEEDHQLQIRVFYLGELMVTETRQYAQLPPKLRQMVIFHKTLDLSQVLNLSLRVQLRQMDH